MGLELAAALTLLLLALTSLAAVAAAAVSALRARGVARRERPAGEMQPLNNPEAEKANRTSTVRAASQPLTQSATFSPGTLRPDGSPESGSGGSLGVPCPVAALPKRQRHTVKQAQGRHHRFPATITCSVKLQPETHGSGDLHLRLSADASAALSRRVIADLTTAAARLGPGLPGRYPPPKASLSAPPRPGVLRLVRCGSSSLHSARHKPQRSRTAVGGSALASLHGQDALPPGVAAGSNDAGSCSGELAHVQPPRYASGAFQRSFEAVGGGSESPAWKDGSSPEPRDLALLPRPTLSGSSGGSSPRPRPWWRRRDWTQARLVPVAGEGAPAVEELEEALTLVGGRSNISAVCVPGCVQLLLTVWHNTAAIEYEQQQRQPLANEAIVSGAGGQPGHDTAAVHSPGGGELATDGAEGGNSSGRTSRASEAGGHRGPPAVVEAVVRWGGGQGVGGGAWDPGYGAEQASGELTRGLQLQDVLGSLIRPLLLLPGSSTPPLDQQAPPPPPAAAASSPGSSDSGGGGDVFVSYRYRRSARAMAWPLAVPLAAADINPQAPPPLAPSAGCCASGSTCPSGHPLPAASRGGVDGSGVLTVLLQRRVVSRLSSVRCVLGGLRGEAEMDETAELLPFASGDGGAAEVGAFGRETWTGAGADDGSGGGGGRSGPSDAASMLPGGGGGGGGSEGSSLSNNGAGLDDSGDDDDEFVPIWVTLPPSARRRPGLRHLHVLGGRRREATTASTRNDVVLVASGSGSDTGGVRGSDVGGSGNGISISAGGEGSRAPGGASSNDLGLVHAARPPAHAASAGTDPGEHEIKETPGTAGGGLQTAPEPPPSRSASFSSLPLASELLSTLPLLVLPPHAAAEVQHLHCTALTHFGAWGGQQDGEGGGSDSPDGGEQQQQQLAQEQERGQEHASVHSPDAQHARSLPTAPNTPAPAPDDGTPWAPGAVASQHQVSAGGGTAAGHEGQAAAIAAAAADAASGGEDSSAPPSRGTASAVSEGACTGPLPVGPPWLRQLAAADPHAATSGTRTQHDVPAVRCGDSAHLPYARAACEASQQGMGALLLDLGTVMRVAMMEQQQQQQQRQTGEEVSAVVVGQGAAVHVDETEYEDSYPVLPPREVVEELRANLEAYFTSHGMAACREVCGRAPSPETDAPPVPPPPPPSIPQLAASPGAGEAATATEAAAQDPRMAVPGGAPATGAAVGEGFRRGGTGEPTGAGLDLDMDLDARAQWEGPMSPFTAAASTAAPGADRVQPVTASGLRRRTPMRQGEEEQRAAVGSAGAGQLPGAGQQLSGRRLPGAAGVVRLGSQARSAVSRLGGWLNGGPDSGSEDFHNFRAKREQRRGLAGACGLLAARGAFFVVQALRGKGAGEERAAAAAGEVLAALLWVASTLVLLLGALLLGRLQGRARPRCWVATAAHLADGLALAMVAASTHMILRAEAQGRVHGDSAAVGLAVPLSVLPSVLIPSGGANLRRVPLRLPCVWSVAIRRCGGLSMFGTLWLAAAMPLTPAQQALASLLMLGPTAALVAAACGSALKGVAYAAFDLLASVAMAALLQRGALRAYGRAQQAQQQQVPAAQ